MDLTNLEELGGICQQMMSEQVAEVHWNDYQELFARIRSQIMVVRAVMTIQSAVRGKQARDEATVRKELADQTKAALTFNRPSRLLVHRRVDDREPRSAALLSASNNDESEKCSGNLAAWAIKSLRPPSAERTPFELVLEDVRKIVEKERLNPEPVIGSGKFSERKKGESF